MSRGTRYVPQRERWVPVVICDGCDGLTWVLDRTDLPRDWAARVEGADLVRHYCPACDSRAGRPGSR